MKKIELIQSDGLMHTVYVIRADVTKDNKIVISFYDFSKGMRAIDYAEIVRVGDLYYKNPIQHEWDYYVRNFSQVDNDLSKFIIEQLNPRIVMCDISDVKNGNKKIDSLKTNSITAIMYTDDGGYVDITNPEVMSPLFFSQMVFSGKELYLEEYTKRNLTKAEEDEILKRIISKYGDSFNVRRLPISDKIRTSSNVEYDIRYSYCNDKELFDNLRKGYKIQLNNSDFRQKGVYTDSLSAALHYELPFKLNMNNGEIISYTVKKEKNTMSL